MSNSEWLTKRPSPVLFELASGIMLAVAVLLVVVVAASNTSALTFMETSIIFKTFCGLLGVIAALAGMYLALGMLWYWAVLDHSTRFHKAVWFLAFLLTGFFGLALYCILVYRRQACNRVVAGGLK